MGKEEADEGLGVHGAVDWISRRRHPVLENRGFLRQLVDQCDTGLALRGQVEASHFIQASSQDCEIAPEPAALTFVVGRVCERADNEPAETQTSTVSNTRM